MNREPNTVYVLSLSYGKDSLAAIEACKRLGYPIDRIVHAEVWATDDIPADLPPMVEFKAIADKIIKERYGLTVEHVCAMTSHDKKFGGGGGYKQTYQRYFYGKHIHGKACSFPEKNGIFGFPVRQGAWCCGHLKQDSLREINLLRYFLQTAEIEESQKIGGGVPRYGFPLQKGQWCNSMLKMAALRAGQARAASIARENSSVRLSDQPSRELVYESQNKGFQRRPRTTGEK